MKTFIKPVAIALTILGLSSGMAMAQEASINPRAQDVYIARMSPKTGEPFFAISMTTSQGKRIESNTCTSMGCAAQFVTQNRISKNTPVVISMMPSAAKYFTKGEFGSNNVSINIWHAVVTHTDVADLGNTPTNVGKSPGVRQILAVSSKVGSDDLKILGKYAANTGAGLIGEKGTIEHVAQFVNPTGNPGIQRIRATLPPEVAQEAGFSAASRLYSVRPGDHQSNLKYDTLRCTTEGC